jgi:hypothetical protein
MLLVHLHPTLPSIATNDPISSFRGVHPAPSCHRTCRIRLDVVVPLLRYQVKGKPQSQSLLSRLALVAVLMMLAGSVRTLER